MHTEDTPVAAPRRRWRGARFRRDRDLATEPGGGRSEEPLGDEVSPTPRSSCYAPTSTMYLDQLGRVRACCQNTGTLLGNVTEQSLREIWSSEAAERLRSALERDDYSEGCQFCAWQVEEGNEEVVFARQYDDLRPEQPRPEWPLRLELALTNTCNLQCAMCNGEWSSAIRSQREHLDPLPKVYGEPFFAELAELLPHLRSVQFAGGEPFLGAEPRRVMDMLAALDAPPRVSIITNGTVANPAVDRILRTLRPELIVSIDGATPATYDGIRVGAHLPDVLANLDRFIAAVGRERVSITTCLMASNWHEFHEVLGLAEERDIGIGVNVVRLPAEHSLYQMAPADLEDVVVAMRRTEPALTGARRAAWTGHLAALEHRVAILVVDDAEHPVPGQPVELPPAPTSRWPWLPFPEQGEPRSTPPDLASDGPEAHLVVDTDGRVAPARVDGPSALDPADLADATVGDLFAQLSDRFGDPDAWILAERVPGVDDDRFWTWLPAVGEQEPHELVGVARRDPAGLLTGARLILRPQTRPPGQAWT